MSKAKFGFSGLILVLSLTSLLMAQTTRPAVWAGQFYPDNPLQLRQIIEEWFAATLSLPPAKNIRAIIVPHAGYIYSGSVAAKAYAQVKSQSISTVIIMGPAHHYAFRGVSIDQDARYQTPLGLIEVDSPWAAKLAQLTGYKTIPQAHKQEHSIEVQLPFIQVAWPQAKIVPVVFGYPRHKDVQKMAKALTKIMANPQVLVVATTDLSHYLPQAKANQVDAQTIKLIENLQAETLLQKATRGENIMCGVGPVSSLLLAAKQLKTSRLHILEYRDSTAGGGPASQVVGYVAATLEISPQSSGGKTEEALTEQEKKELLRLAREAITLFLQNKNPPHYTPSSPRLLEKKGVFVTLHHNGRLRGCIGFIESSLPLYQTVIQAAIYAAVKDVRFNPVSLDELPDVEIEISVLTPLTKITNPAQIQVGRHGLVIEKGRQKGLLLPQVALENGWDRLTFLRRACLKAGLPPNAWRQGAKIFTFEAQVFAEKPKEEA